jgi:hypothetical protein
MPIKQDNSRGAFKLAIAAKTACSKDACSSKLEYMRYMREISISQSLLLLGKPVMFNLKFTHQRDRPHQ